jgi:hypothetical protein
MELLCVDQNYLSGMVKRKVAFREFESALSAAVARGAVAGGRMARVRRTAGPAAARAAARISSPASRSRTSVAPWSATER